MYEGDPVLVVGGDVAAVGVVAAADLEGVLCAAGGGFYGAGAENLEEGIGGLMAEKKKAKNEGLINALRVVLDHVDYTAGNCRVNEMIGAVLPKSVITMARAEIEKAKAPTVEPGSEPEYIDDDAYGYE
jgi:hypothetical protein